ncbi:FAD-dependent oxidoreductase [Falsigemmobacter faecalis]|uniref:FAD-dependent oxidoreductase n=1 Tax=Falsigemmobacter faecalis TaxID=2488730 RepID=A0A3P3D3M7_9RHOB|nr:FAD-dependent oxidoreductase [Falsigemmobacter faecalis]RRH68374.1 FAD-dependent oxidoreductase [Falsigemmobacter faecalis]
MTQSFLTEPARDIPVTHRPDVLVVGGGAAGIAAACAAARAGCSVLLTERFGFLGGTLTAVTLGGMCGGYGNGSDGLFELVGGIYARICERLFRLNGALPVRRSARVHALPYDPNLMKLVTEELCREHGVELLYHTSAVAVHSTEDRITAVVLENRGGRSAVIPGMVIDCSGDGDIAAFAGAEFELGHDGHTQFSSSMFRASNVDTAAFSRLTREDMRAILEKVSAAEGELPRTAVALYPGPVAGMVHFNATKLARPDGTPFNLTDPAELTEAEQEGRRQAYRYLDVARRHLPGFEKAQIADIGPMVGIRETRRITGDYILTEEDVLNCVKPADTIACSAWPVEMHAPGRGTIWRHLPDGDYYGIPYRSLTVKGFANLLVSGRNLSATQTAQASARVSATCFAMGEAAGMAAAMALGTGGNSRAVSVPALIADLTDAGAVLHPIVT